MKEQGYPQCQTCGVMMFDVELDNFRGRKRRYCHVCAKARQLMAIRRNRARKRV